MSRLDASHLSNDGYSNDILKNLFVKEKRRPRYLKQSPQLHMRRYLVDLLALIGEQMRLCRITHHLSIYLLDYFMDHHDIEESRLHLVSLGCLLIASKFEEKDQLVPRTSELNAFVDNEYILTEYILMELVLLEYYNWNLMVPTAAHFIEYFSKYAISKSDLHCGQTLPCLQKAESHVHQYIGYFLDVSLQDQEFLDYPPSMVAAACIAASRLRLYLTPTWPLNLHNLTHYNYEQLLPCVAILLRALERDECAERKAENNDTLVSSPASCASSSSYSSSSDTSLNSAIR